MQITDPIADLLTRIRNASSSKHETVDVPASNMKKAIVEILNDEGYIKDFQVIEDGKQGVIRITLKYGPNKEAVLREFLSLVLDSTQALTNFQEFLRVLVSQSFQHQRVL